MHSGHVRVNTATGFALTGNFPGILMAQISKYRKQNQQLIMNM